MRPAPEMPGSSPIPATSHASPAVRAVVLSRAGLASLPAELPDRLPDDVSLTAHRCSQAPTARQSRALLAGAHLLAATNACLPRLDEPLLAALPELREVVLYATGADHVDTGLLSRRGVRLTLLPDYATEAVAEHGIALLFTLAARVHLAHDRSRGLAPSEVSLRGVELAGRTLGVVGLGRIGRRTAELGRAIGMRVIGHDPRPIGQVDVPIVPLAELLAASDAVAVCASRRFGAAALLGPAELDAMRAGSFLVNASRAALVDTPAAVAAVAAGRLRGYAVDDTVLDPADPLHARMLAEGRILQTGHSAWWRDEVLARGATAWGEALLAAVDRLLGSPAKERLA